MRHHAFISTVIGLMSLCIAHAADSPLRDVAKALDLAQKHVNEYGTMNVSAPILTFARSNEFEFALKKGAEFYFSDAKTNLQGRAATFNQTFNSTLFRADVEGDPTIA